MSFLTLLPPGGLMMLGALLLFFVPRRVVGHVALALPIISFIHLTLLPGDLSLELSFFDNTLTGPLPTQIGA